MIAFLPSEPWPFPPGSAGAFTAAVVECCDALPLIEEADDVHDGHTSLNAPDFLDALIRAREDWVQLLAHWTLAIRLFTPREMPLALSVSQWPVARPVDETDPRHLVARLGNLISYAEQGDVTGVAAETLAELTLPHQLQLMSALAQTACRTMHADAGVSCQHWATLRQTLDHLMPEKARVLKLFSAFAIASARTDLELTLPAHMPGLPVDIAMTLAMCAAGAIPVADEAPVMIVRGDNLDAPPESVLTADYIDPTPGEDNPHWALGLAWKLVTGLRAVTSAADVERVAELVTSLPEPEQVLEVARVLAIWVRDFEAELEDRARQRGMRAPAHY